MEGFIVKISQILTHGFKIKWKHRILKVRQKGADADTCRPDDPMWERESRGEEGRERMGREGGGGEGEERRGRSGQEEGTEERMVKEVEGKGNMQLPG